MSVFISPVVHPEPNIIEIVWGTVKVALHKSNLSFSLARLKELAAVELCQIIGQGVGAQ